MLPLVRGMHIPSHTGHNPHERRRAKMEAKTQANANALSNRIKIGSGSQNLIVRVKRLRTQDPVESMCIIEETETRDEDLSQAPHKRRHLKASANKLSNAFNGSDLLGNGSGLNKNNNNRILLTRIGTVLQGDDVDKLDTDTLTLNKRGRENDNDIIQITNKNNDTFNRDSCLWITNGKKSIKNNEDLDSSYVIVDLSQISVIGNNANEKKIVNEKPVILSNSDKLALAMKESKDMLLASSAAKNSINDINSSSNKTKISILDPTSRILDSAIKKGFETGDFTEMANAFTLGANINYQRSKPSGHTCLMVAVMYGNVRMVKRLISKGADTLIPDSNGKIAWDYLKDANVLQSISLTVSKDIALLLHNATLKRHGHGGGEESYRGIENREVNMYNNGDNSIVSLPQRDEDETYVIDIFVISKNKQESSNNKEMDSIDNEGFEIINNNPEFEEMEGIDGVDTKIYPISSSSSLSSQQLKPPEVDDFSGPIVPIEGLKIHGDGNVEIVYAYDSDWSDLGDDEDYDSNDERYIGNDYPEDEESDEANRVNLSEEDDSDIDDSDDDIDNGRMPRFEKKSVGRVLRHGVTDDPFAPLSRDKNKLQQLWGVTSNNSDEDEDEPVRSQRERIEGMKHKSGMDFASVPREFDNNGLPKYGNELSDDDIDVELLRQAFDDAEQGDKRRSSNQFPAWSKQAQSTSNGETFQGQGQGFGEDRHMSYNHIMPSNTNKPPRNTVAFDPELDMEDDHDADF